MTTKRLLDVRLPARLPSAALARRHVEGLDVGLLHDRLDDLRLLVSEVVTNSIRHSQVGEGGWIGLRISLEGGTLRTEVVDAGEGFARGTPRLDPVRVGGWGLVLVDELADRWGVSLDGTTQVWFEFDLEDGAEG